MTIVDASPEMVAEGRKRAEAEGYGERCSFMVGNAEALAVPDKSFDAYMIAFGLRNVTHPEKALSEAYRVLKPGGRFLCMEFSHMNFPGWTGSMMPIRSPLFRPMGKAVTGSGEPYRYLVESIRTFPNQRQLMAKIARFRSGAGAVPERGGRNRRHPFGVAAVNGQHCRQCVASAAGGPNACRL